MSQVENAAKPRLLPMIGGQEGALTPSDQQIVAVWAVLKAMTFEFTSASTRQPFFSAEERRAFRDTRVPPAPVQVYLAGYVGRYALWASGAPSVLTVGSDTFNAYASTASFGVLVFQVFSHRAPQRLSGVRLADAFSGAEIRIWPRPPGPAIWPPEFVLDQPMLEKFAKRWSAPPESEA